MKHHQKKKQIKNHSAHTLCLPWAVLASLSVTQIPVSKLSSPGCRTLAPPPVRATNLPLLLEVPRDLSISLGPRHRSAQLQSSNLCHCMVRTPPPRGHPHPSGPRATVFPEQPSSFFCTPFGSSPEPLLYALTLQLGAHTSVSLSFLPVPNAASTALSCNPKLPWELLPISSAHS